MAIRQYDVKGLQFHPESILTEHGKEMLRNWLAIEGTYGNISRRGMVHAFSDVTHTPLSFMAESGMAVSTEDDIGTASFSSLQPQASLLAFRVLLR
jgi:hypothetical protein